MPEIIRQVAQSSDDAFRCQAFAAFFSLTERNIVGRTALTVPRNGCGMRFTNITIPNAATILNAYLTITYQSAAANIYCNSQISAEAVDDASTFADDWIAFDARRTNITTATVNWDNIPLGDAFGALLKPYNSPNIATIIQEMVDRPGWVSGNDLVIFWDDFDNRTAPVSPANYAARWAYSYDDNSELAPWLTIVTDPAPLYTSDSDLGVTRKAFWLNKIYRK